MRNIYSTFLALSMIGLLLLSACGSSEPECVSSRDCDDGISKTVDSCITGKCRNEEKKCTSDSQCDDKNAGTTDTCSSGVCSFKKVTVKKEISTVDNTYSKDVSLDGFDIEVRTTVKQPFTIDKDYFEVEFELVELDEEVIDPTIDRIIIMVKDLQYVDFEVERTFYDVGQSFKVLIPLLDFDLDSKVSSIKPSYIIKYNAKEVSDKGVEKIEDEKSVSLSKTFDIIKSKEDPECKSKNCDDDNPCTKDSCISGTWFCEFTPTSNCISNYVCESTENRCTAPIDCGECDGSYGKYLDLHCEGTACIAEIEMNPTTKTVINELSTSDFTAELKTTYPEPFDIKSSVLTLEYKITEIDEDIKSLASSFKQIRLFEGDVLLGELTLKESLRKKGESFTVELPLDFDMSFPEETKKVKLETTIDYNMVDDDGERGSDSSVESTSFKDKFTFIKSGDIGA